MDHNRFAPGTKIRAKGSDGRATGVIVEKNFTPGWRFPHYADCDSYYAQMYRDGKVLIVHQDDMEPVPQETA